jgi:hypothetical protein
MASNAASFIAAGDYNQGNNPNENKPDNIANGYCVQLAKCENDPVNKISNTIRNFLRDAKKVLAFAGNLRSEIYAAAGILKELGSLLIGSLMNALTNKLKKLIKDGITAAIAGSGGLALPSLIALGPAMEALMEGMKCLMNKIINGIEGLAVDLLSNIVGQIQNFATCAAEQFCGAFINPLIDQIADGMGSLLKPLEKIISPAFKVIDFLLGALDAISAIRGLFQCNEENECPKVNGYYVGGDFCQGDEKEEPSDLDKILNKMSISRGAANLANDFEGQFGKWDIFGDGTTLNDSGLVGATGSCYTGNPFECGAPNVTIFGGGGAGAVGKAILGNIVDNTEGLSEAVDKVGSVVGVDLLSGGSGYKTTPFVTISDSCGMGYGGYAKANINAKGEVTSITVISSGTRYPVTDIIPLGIADAVIENPGSNYSPDDTIDGFDIVVDGGRIISAKINTAVPVDGLPELKVNTKTGSGAIIRPIINSLPVVEKKLQQVIDCIE